MEKYALINSKSAISTYKVHTLVHVLIHSIEYSIIEWTRRQSFSIFVFFDHVSKCAASSIVVAILRTSNYFSF